MKAGRSRFLLRASRRVVAVAASIAILVVGWTNWGWYRPDLLIDPINRHVHLAYLECRDTGRCPTNWGGWRSMVPDVFEIGGQHDDVIKRLRDAGVEEWYVDGGEENYRRIGAALSPLFCRKYYNIKVVFDPSGRLASSESTFTGTPSCL